MQTGRLLLLHCLSRLAHRTAVENLSRVGVRFLLRDRFLCCE
eukprot:COSAG02_NODE_1134_length_14376_cov_382.343700_4_plen_42_part_00